MNRLWIEERLKEVKKKKGDLGKALGLPSSRISDLIHGKRRLQSSEIPQLSDFLEMDIGSIINHIHREAGTTDPQKTVRTEQITVIGAKEASEDCYFLWPVCDQYIITLPIHSNFIGINKFALEEINPRNKSRDLHICIKKADMPSRPKAENSKNRKCEKKKEIKCMNPVPDKAGMPSAQTGSNKDILPHAGDDTAAVIISLLQEL